MTKRTRGGQPGNQNARKHGLYSTFFTETQKESLPKARTAEGLDQEIAILRVKVLSVLQNDPHNISALTTAISLLARAVSMQHRLAIGASREGKLPLHLPLLASQSQCAN